MLSMSDEDAILKLADGDQEHFRVLEHVVAGWPLREHCATVQQITIERLVCCPEDIAAGLLARVKADAARRLDEALATRAGALVFGRRFCWVLIDWGQDAKLDPARIDPDDYLTHSEVLSLLHRIRLGLPSHGPSLYQLAAVASATIIPAGR